MNDLLRQRMAEIDKTRRIKNKNEPFHSTIFDIIGCGFDFSLLHYIQLNYSCYDIYQKLLVDVIALNVNESINESAYEYLKKAKKIVKQNRFKYYGTYIFSILRNFIIVFSNSKTMIVGVKYSVRNIHFSFRLANLFYDATSLFQRINKTISKLIDEQQINYPKTDTAIIYSFNEQFFENYLELFDRLELANGKTYFTPIGIKIMELFRGVTGIEGIDFSFTTLYYYDEYRYC